MGTVLIYPRVSYDEPTPKIVRIYKDDDEVYYVEYLQLENFELPAKTDILSRLDWTTDINEVRRIVGDDTGESGD